MMKLRTELVAHPSQLTEECRQRWNELARNPFQSWDWLGSWAEAFSEEYSPAILKVTSNQGRILGFAPFCVENRLAFGRTISFLGSGKACSDHLSILAEEGKTTPVSRAIADWLVNHHSGDFSWDHLELIGVDLHDLGVDLLADALKKQGVQVEVKDGLGCYAIDLPLTWDEYVKMRSKSGRREIRQALRKIDDGKVQLKLVTTEQQLSQHWPHFVELHQRRRNASGTDGCFDHSHFEQFLRTAAERLLSKGQLRFLVATAEDQPIAVQFAVADESTWY
ncbi:MAG: GNAT family N-acetyltransferase, partial [Planctomycetota bacterium]